MSKFYFLEFTCWTEFTTKIQFRKPTYNQNRVRMLKTIQLLFTWILSTLKVTILFIPHSRHPFYNDLLVLLWYLNSTIKNVARPRENLCLHDHLTALDFSFITKLLLFSFINFRFLLLHELCPCL